MGVSLQPHLLWWLMGSRACGLQQLQRLGSVVAALGLQRAGPIIVAPWLGCSAARGIFPDETESPALAGGFFTTEPPGKPLLLIYLPSLFLDYLFGCVGS